MFWQGFSNFITSDRLFLFIGNDAMAWPLQTEGSQDVMEKKLKVASHTSAAIKMTANLSSLYQTGPSSVLNCLFATEMLLKQADLCLSI